MRKYLLLAIIIFGATFAQAGPCEDYKGSYFRLAFPDDLLRIEEDFLFGESYIKFTGFSIYPQLNSVPIRVDGKYHKEILSDGTSIGYNASCSLVDGVPALWFISKEDKSDLERNILISQDHDKSGIIILDYIDEESDKRNQDWYFYSKK